MSEQRKQTSNRKRHGAAIGLFMVAGVLALSIGRLISDGTPASSRAAEPAGGRWPIVVPVDRALEVPVEFSGGAVAVAKPEGADADVVVRNERAKPQAAAVKPVVTKTDEAWPMVALGAVRPEAADVALERSLLITDGLEDGKVALVMNKSTVLATRTAYKRVSVGAPDVADVNPIGPNNILVTAKKPGTTQLIVWDDADRSQVVDLAVQVDLAALQEQFKQQFPSSKIDVSMANGQVVLRGQAPNLVAAEQAVQLAQPYATKVLNFLEISGGQQVMLQVRFAEVSRSATNTLGFNFGTTDGRSFF